MRETEDLRKSCIAAGLDASGTREEAGLLFLGCGVFDDRGPQLEERLGLGRAVTVTVTNRTKYSVSGLMLFGMYRFASSYDENIMATSTDCVVPPFGSVPFELPAERRNQRREVEKVVWHGLMLNANGLKW
jgi:hypothetical protein